MNNKITDLSQFEKLSKTLSTKYNHFDAYISVCKGTGCSASGSIGIAEAFKKEIKKQKLEDKINIRSTGCHGFCECGPLAVIYPKEIFYQKIKLDDVPEIISKTIQNNEIIDRLLYTNPATNKKITVEKEVPFIKNKSGYFPVIIVK